MNVVRRRYFETPQFLAFGSMSTTQERRAQVGVAGFGIDADSVFTGAAGATELEVTDYPTYTVTPQQGPEMAKRLHQQLPLNVVAELANAGYPAELIFTLVAQDVSGVRGVEVGAGAAFRAGSPDYMRMLHAMHNLESSNHLVVTEVVWEQPHFVHPFSPENLTPTDILAAAGAGNTFETIDGGKTFYVSKKEMVPALWIEPKARNSEAGRELIGTIHLDSNPTKRVWPLRNIKVIEGPELASQSDQPREYIDVRTRSFYGVLNLLSQGVQLPVSGPDPVAELTRQYREAVAQGYAPNIAQQFFVHYSPTKPKNAFVMTKFKDGWFYIDEHDFSSKRVFNAVYDIYNLQVSPMSTVTEPPALSLPAR